MPVATVRPPLLPQLQRAEGGLSDQCNSRGVLSSHYVQATSHLKTEPQSKLHEAREVGLRTHHAKAGVGPERGPAARLIGIAKLGPISQVEELGSELYPEPFLWAEFRVLEDR